MAEPIHQTTALTDAEIRAEWQRITRLYDRGRSLARRIALIRADQLEARGVTEADIDRVMA